MPDLWELEVVQSSLEEHWLGRTNPPGKYADQSTYLCVCCDQSNRVCRLGQSSVPIRGGVVDWIELRMMQQMALGSSSAKLQEGLLSGNPKFEQMKCKKKIKTWSRKDQQFTTRT